MSSPPIRISHLAAGLAAVLAIALAAPTQAQIGPARRITGAPVANEAVRARFAWGGTGNRIIWVNQADEVYYQRVHSNRVDRHIRMRGHTVGVRGDQTEYVIPWDNNAILVVTQRGSLYRHQIRNESVGPPEQIQGAPVGTQGQDPVFMFRVANRLINVTQQGEVWAHQVGNVVSPPQRLGRVAIASPRQVRHVFNVGRAVYIVSDQGEVYRHDVHPDFGQGRLVQTRANWFAQPNTRFAFVMNNGLYVVGPQGELWVHDVSRLMQNRRGVRGQRAAPQPAQPAQPPTGG